MENDRWKAEADRLKSLSEETLKVIRQRDKVLRNGGDAHQLQETVTNNLASLNTDITALEKELSTDEQNRSIGADELRRREVVVIDLISFRDRLDVLAANPNKKDRNVRFSDSVTTIRLDDSTSLVELQRAQLDQQDRHLDALSESVGRTKNIAVSISDELDAQAALVEDLDHKVDRTRSKMSSTTSSVDRVIRSLKRDRSSQVVCALVVVIVFAVVLIIVLKTAL